MSDNITPTIYQLTEELMSINDWYSLGVALMVPPSKLEEIQKSSPQDGIQRWRINLLQYWLNSTPDASWSMIVLALEKIGHRTLAASLRGKYCVLQTTSVADQQHGIVTTPIPAATPAVTTTQAIVSEKYRKDFEDIQNRFVKLFDEVAEMLENEESINIKRLKGYVSKIPEMKDSLDNVHTISDIIDIIQEHSSFTCCSHLEGVARRFNISAATEKIESYYQFMNEFCQCKLTHHIYMKPFLTAKPTDFTPSTTITFKLRWSPAKKTLSDIQHLLQQAFDEQNVFVHIVVVRGGSVRVICCAPQYLMTELVRLAQKNRELLVESSVTYLRVGDTIVVDTSDRNEISLVEDLVFQLTIALQLKGDHGAHGPSSNMGGKTTVQSMPSMSSIWLITVDQATLVLTDTPNETFLVRENRGRPVFDPSSTSINTHIISVIVNGKIHHVAIYKKGNYYGFLNNENYPSVEHFVADLSRTGMRFKDNTIVSLTNRLIPDRDTLAKLPVNIPAIIPRYTFSDVASLPKHYPHHDESTWLCRQLSKEESERLLRGRVDETFLVRATDLSGPTHIYTVDIVVQKKVINLCVYRDGDWLQFEPWRQRYDSINTLVMHHVTVAYTIPIGDCTVLAYFRYPVYSSEYYK